MMIRKRNGLHIKIILMGTLLVLLFGACASTREKGTQLKGKPIKKRQMQKDSGGSEKYEEYGFSTLPEQGPDFWTKMMTPDIAYQYRAINGRTKCTIFVGDMLTEYFGEEIFLKVFPEGVRGSNQTFLDWMENKSLIRLTPDRFSITDIQALADAGYLILMAYYYPEIAGHVAFVGHSDLKLFTVPILNDLEGKIGTQLDESFLPVMVQAGTYTGITSMVYATNGWLRSDNYGNGSVRYYAVTEN